jgi:lysophospholipase L1-like esterase
VFWACAAKKQAEARVKGSPKERRLRTTDGMSTVFLDCDILLPMTTKGILRLFRAIIHPFPALTLLTVVALNALATLPASSQTAASSMNWVGSWAASQQIPEPQNALPDDDLHDATVRQIVHLSIGGGLVRVHLSNAFGKAPLHFTSVHIARPVSLSVAKIDPATDKALTFAGSADVLVPAGAEYLSDPVEYPVAPLSSVAITFHLDQAPVQQTGHPGSRATSYYVHGDQVSSADLPDAKKIDHWYQLAGVDVAAPAGSAAIVALGDSITDGHAATTNGNDRWTDVLAQRLQASPSTRNLSVLNHGIGGNHVLTDGLGPNALARFDRDVLAQAGVRYVLLLEGVNDLGGLTRLNEVPAAEHDLLVHRILSAYQQMVLRAHAHGIQVIGATILPYTGSDYYHPGPTSEADRQAINQWIRVPGHFDGVVDFDKVMRDPAHPERMLPAFDSGDHLHPSPAGYKAMGEAVPLALFAR